MVLIDRENMVAFLIRLIPALITLTAAIINAKAKAPHRKPKKKRKR